MTQAESYLELLDRHLAAENAHDMAGTLATLTEDCEFVDVALGRRWSAHAGAAEHYRMWWDAFDVSVSGERLHLSRDTAVAETTWRGRHVGPFLGVAPTGRDVELQIAVFVEFRDGLMAGERFYWDTAALSDQLGVAVRLHRLVTS
jgi:steroid delta-isomerase-like uncharacterized protein